MIEHVQDAQPYTIDRCKLLVELEVFAYPRHRARLTESVTPLKPLEAMAQGRALVASDVGGHHELIRHGETGRLFEAGNAVALAEAVLALLEDRDGAAAIRRRARRFSSRPSATGPRPCAATPRSTG